MLVDTTRIAAALPGYEIGGQLGAGGSGIVVAGRHRQLGRFVAIKVIRENAAREVSRFASEARLLATFDHPHIVRVYDYVESEDINLIVMEQLSGGPLHNRLREGVSVEAACALGLALAEALEHAHRARVLHRDVKPSNVLFTGDGIPKMTDFGIAKIFDGSIATASIAMGTPSYMAPEQWTGGTLTPATDIYALGLVIYELLAGTLPFKKGLSPLAILHDRLVNSPAPLNPEKVPGQIAEVVMRALAVDPEDRLPSALEFAAELAYATTASIGPDWLTHAGIPVYLSDDVRNAAIDITMRPSPTALDQVIDQGNPTPTKNDADEPSTPTNPPRTPAQITTKILDYLPIENLGKKYTAGAKWENNYSGGRTSFVDRKE